MEPRARVPTARAPLAPPHARVFAQLLLRERARHIHAVEARAGTGDKLAPEAAPPVNP